MDRQQTVDNQARVSARWTIECRGQDGILKWREEYFNLITTEGLNALITNTFKTIPGSVTWYVGLKGTGSEAIGDTMASHAGWAEVTGYSEGARQTFTPGTVAAGAVNNSAAKAVFSINATVTAAGAFLTSNSTKSGTTGTLYGVGNFSVSRSLVNLDTLSVQVDLSAA